MQVLKVLFQFFLLVAVLSVATFFVSREILLAVALTQIKTEVQMMKQFRQSATYDAECMQLGSSVGLNSGNVNQLQLRFTSPTDYVIEAVCNGFPFNPIVATTKKLPPFVTKEAGKSGIIWGDAMNGLRIQCLGREGGIYVDGDAIVTNLNQVVGVELQPGPVTSCSGNSYACCESETEYGVGPVQSSAQDCPQSCYSSCKSRPVVLSFQTNPFYDLITRQVTVPNKQSVGFSYVASSNNTDTFGSDQIATDSGAPATLLLMAEKIGEAWKNRKNADTPETYSVQLSFGDGQQTKMTDLQGSVDHVYTCAAPPCTYTAKIVVKSSKGVESASTVINSVDILVIP